MSPKSVYWPQVNSRSAPDMLFCSWDIVCDRCNLFFTLDYFLPFYSTNNSPKDQNSEKMKKHCLETSSFYIWVPRVMIRWCTVLRYGAWQTDEWKKWHIEVAAPPKSSFIYIRWWSSKKYLLSRWYLPKIYIFIKVTKMAKKINTFPTRKRTKTYLTGSQVSDLAMHLNK